MKDLATSIQESLHQNMECLGVNEGLIRDAVSLVQLEKIDPSKMLETILNMYDYIVDNDDIDLFYQDVPLGEKTLWKYMYKLYQSKAWSIIDVPQVIDGTDDSDETLDRTQSQTQEFVNNSFPTIGQLIKVTPEFRRHLRFFINNSKNSGLDLKPGLPEYMMLIPDELKNCSYIITINRTTGLLRRMFNMADKNLLIKAFKQINNA